MFISRLKYRNFPQWSHLHSVLSFWTAFKILFLTLEPHQLKAWIYFYNYGDNGNFVLSVAFSKNAFVLESDKWVAGWLSGTRNLTDGSKKSDTGGGSWIFMKHQEIEHFGNDGGSESQLAGMRSVSVQLAAWRSGYMRRGQPGENWAAPGFETRWAAGGSWREFEFLNRWFSEGSLM